MSEKITVIAYAAAKPGREKELKKALQSMVVPTRAEKGCLNYDLHESSDQPGAFMFHENWSSKEALDAHLKTKHIADAMNEAKEHLAGPVQITLWSQL